MTSRNSDSKHTEQVQSDNSVPLSMDERWRTQAVPYIVRVLKLSAGVIVAVTIILRLLAVLIDEQTVYGVLNLPSKDYVDRCLSTQSSTEAARYDSLMVVLTDIRLTVRIAKLNLDTLSTRQNYSALIQALAIGQYSFEEENALLMQFADGVLNTDQLLRKAYERRRR